ncbi:MAG TPA: hypothetical protein VFS67_09310 [Polyangiaceae bacterium]|nr:hypothetical protein [Polyangiaceae bacterium]
MRAPSAVPLRSLRSSRPRALRIGFALALALHALGLGTVALLGRQFAAAQRVAPAQPASDPAELVELELESPDGDAVTAEVPALAAQQTRSAPDAPRLAAVAPRARRAATESGSARGAGAAAEADASAEGEGASSDAANPAGAASKQGLSLDALGVGPGNNPFLARSGRPSGTQRRLADQIDHVLRSGLARHDQQLGLGPEGPAVAAVTDLVMQSTSAPNTSALLVLRTDGAGETVHVGLAEASGDTAAWNAIAAELQKALHGKKLRVPAGSGGVTMQLRVESREQLPSGADPGLAIDLFGQEVKSGAGDRATRLQLLTPKIVLEQYQVSSTDPHAKVPVVGVQFALVAVQGDPVDIAAVARRVVHAHLVSLETHPRESPRREPRE